jgi:hypothetical protein
MPPAPRRSASAKGNPDEDHCDKVLLRGKSTAKAEAIAQSEYSSDTLPWRSGTHISLAMLRPRPAHGLSDTCRRMSDRRRRVLLTCIGSAMEALCTLAGALSRASARRGLCGAQLRSERCTPESRMVTLRAEPFALRSTLYACLARLRLRQVARASVLRAAGTAVVFAGRCEDTSESATNGEASGVEGYCKRPATWTLRKGKWRGRRRNKRGNRGANRQRKQQTNKKKGAGELCKMHVGAGRPSAARACYGIATVRVW